MISSMTQLQGTLEQIAWASNALEGLRRSATDQDALLFPLLAESYISHIRAMTAEAQKFLEALAPAEQADYLLPVQDEHGIAA